MATLDKMANPKQFSDAPASNDLYTQGWFRAKVWLDSLKSSVFTSNQGLVNPIDTNGTKEAIKVSGQMPFVRISDKDTGVFRSDGKVTLAMELALEGEGFFGNNPAIASNEEVVRTLQQTVTANLSGNALTSFNMPSLEKLDNDWVKSASGVSCTRLLSQWSGENTDKKIMSAFLTGHSHDLEEAPIGLSAATVTSNVIFANKVSAPSEAGRIVDPATKVATLALVAAGAATIAAGGAAPEDHLDIPRIIEIGDQCSDDAFMQPIPIMGKLYFIMYVAPEELRWMRSGSVADVWSSLTAIPGEVKQLVPNASLVIDNIIVVANKRSATVEAVGGGLNYGYVGFGNSAGTRTGNVTHGEGFNVNVVVGQNALFNYHRQGTTFAKNLGQYDWNRGDAIYDISSYETAKFSSSEDPAVPVRSIGSAIVLTSRTSTIGG